MALKWFTLLCCCTSLLFNFVTSNVKRKPSVLVSIVARNEEKTLPTFFAYLDLLNYPKDRISLLIQTDHNEDQTALVISEWVSKAKHFYHKVIVRHEAIPVNYTDSQGPNDQTLDRYLQVLDLRQIALDEARKQWADYLFQVNAGNFLLYSDILYDLMNENKTIIAPMLGLFDPKSGYSNFWGAVDERGYYKRVPEYFEILRRNKTGTFEVPMIHSCMLINMNDKRTDKLQFYPISDNYHGETDDILVFAWAVNQTGIKLYVRNEHVYGYMMGIYRSWMTLSNRQQLFMDIFIDYLAYHPPLLRSKYINHTFPEATKKGFDEVFMINLVRRPDRRMKMELSLKELGFDYKHFPAVDGRNLTQEILNKKGIKAMGDFKDPFLERPITFGEIGCFLSHWNIWQEILDRQLDMVLVLEDDVRFESNFNLKLNEVMKEARGLIEQGVEWDIMYFGRKPLIHNVSEILVYGCEKIVWAKYSYWTLGYVIRRSGAQQLIDGKPFGNLIPVDEYIPIKFNEHDDKQLLKKFLPRDMIGFSAEPLLLYPTHYVGDEGYFSDTEDTLSHEGKDVKIFREKKEQEEKEGLEREEREKKEKEEKERKEKEDIQNKEAKGNETLIVGKENGSKEEENKDTAFVTNIEEPIKSVADVQEKVPGNSNDSHQEL